MLVDRKIGIDDKSYLREIDKINNEAFPDIERTETRRMLDICGKIGGNLSGWFDSEKMIGFTMTLENEGCIYLNYLATEQHMRSMGYGNQILEQLLVKNRGKQILLDFEEIVPETSNFDLRKRRKCFYLRNGFYETGYYTLLRGELYELVCSEKQLDINAARDIFEKIHEQAPDFSEHLYSSDKKVMY